MNDLQELDNYENMNEEIQWKKKTAMKQLKASISAVEDSLNTLKEDFKLLNEL